jgi:hypothetical protein
VSSDHDSQGKLKPSHQPFKQKGVTFKSDGKLIKLKLPLLKTRRDFKMEDAIKIIPDEVPKTMADLVKGVKLKGEQKTKPLPLEVKNEEALITQYKDTLS